MTSDLNGTFEHRPFIKDRREASLRLSLPRRGRGTAIAGDRVLSQTAYLRRSPPIFFIPLFPSNLRPFGAPPSIGRRVYPRKPLPLEGAAERSEAGLAFFLGRRSRLLFAFPIGQCYSVKEIVSYVTSCFPLRGKCRRQ